MSVKKVELTFYDSKSPMQEFFFVEAIPLEDGSVRLLLPSNDEGKPLVGLLSHLSRFRDFFFWQSFEEKDDYVGKEVLEIRGLKLT